MSIIISPEIYSLILPGFSLKISAMFSLGNWSLSFLPEFLSGVTSLIPSGIYSLIYPGSPSAVSSGTPKWNLSGIFWDSFRGTSKISFSFFFSNSSRKPVVIGVFSRFFLFFFPKFILAFFQRSFRVSFWDFFRDCSSGFFLESSQNFFRD